jgi:hypothetical protein
MNGKEHRKNFERRRMGGGFARLLSQKSVNITPLSSQSVPKLKSAKALPMERKHPPPPVKHFQADFELKIASKQDDRVEQGQEKTLYALFSHKPPTTKAEEKSRFPEEFRNAFCRKKNVSLVIRDKLVMWDFAYDRTVIDAIKQHVPGRQWNPSLKKWTNPLESLPEAISLYEHMGRTPDESLRKRAKEIVAACGGGNPNQVITLSVRLENDNNNDSSPSPGKVMVKFMYNPKIVAAIKQLPPNQRSFDPLTKQWPVELLALPAMLEHLRPMGYVPCNKVVALSDACQAMMGILYGNIETDVVTDGQICAEVVPSFPAATSIACTGNANDVGRVVIDLSQDSTQVPISREAAPSLSMTAPEPGDTENNFGPTHNYVEAETPIANSTTAGSSEPVQEDIKAALVQAELKKVLTLLNSQSNEQNGNAIDRSDCGQVKKRRLTHAQETWGMKKSVGFYDDDSFDYMGYSDCSLFSSLATRLSSRTTHRFPVDCDCGKPQVLSGGLHVCRYFGTFQCSCGNRWTSGYTWKGEMQACKRCNVESLPVKKEMLTPGGGRGISGRPHDAARCSRCRKLGYDCSGYF